MASSSSSDFSLDLIYCTGADEIKSLQHELVTLMAIRTLPKLVWSILYRIQCISELCGMELFRVWADVYWVVKKSEADKWNKSWVLTFLSETLVRSGVH